MSFSTAGVFMALLYSQPTKSSKGRSSLSGNP